MIPMNQLPGSSSSFGSETCLWSGLYVAIYFARYTLVIFEALSILNSPTGSSINDIANSIKVRWSSLFSVFFFNHFQ